MAGYVKKEYDQQYKRDHFDHITFYAPKGTKDKVKERAKQLDMKSAEYLRYLIEKDTE